MRYLSLAGNIGTGKSTLATGLAQRLECRLTAEPLSENPFLANFYADPTTWAFRLQMFNLSSRASSILEACDGGDFVLDRSFEEDIVFVRTALEDGVTTSEEMGVYKATYDLLRQLVPAPSLVIYLSTSNLEQLRRRILARSRDIEQGITTDYLRSLQRQYDAWFESYQGPKMSLKIDDKSPGELQDLVIERLHETERIES